MANTVKALLALCETVIEAVNESPNGLPEGHLYAALMGVGMNLDTFNKLVGILVSAGKVRKQGFLLFPVSTPGQSG